MVKQSAQQRQTRRQRIVQDNARTLEEKLQRGGQVLPFLGAKATDAPMNLADMAEQLQEMTPHERGEMTDRVFHALYGQMTTGFSPAAMMLSAADWWAHAAMAPYWRLQLGLDALERCRKLALQNNAYLFQGRKEAFDTEEKAYKKRFRHEQWQHWPHNMIASSFLHMEEWWQQTTELRGLNPHNKRMLHFMVTQWLNALSPEHNPLISPDIRETTRKEKGRNLLQGASHLLEDTMRQLTHKPDIGVEHFRIGKDVATTEGKVIYRNALFELIQYSPQTKEVYKEPLLIVPAWIMKYYILDLEPHHSMVRYLVEQGHTVFMISWKNPDSRYREIGFTDYLNYGLLEAYKQVQQLVPEHKPHMVGYCIGGTLLAMASALLAAKEEDAFATITLFAALTDFEEPGQLMTFIDESQLTYLEDIMYAQGYLRGDQISAAFDMLKPRQLIWAKIAQNYLKGERPDPFDLMAWSEDTTRLPYRMHSEYLRHLYMENALAEGELEVDGITLDLDAIKTPMFVVTTEHDHIAPWKSVYKINLLTSTELTFVLANKGHNGGIISEPEHEGRSYRIAKREAGGKYIQPEKWKKQQSEQDGSWWLAWHDWLVEHSSGKGKPPAMGEALADAPGLYVHEH